MILVILACAALAVTLLFAFDRQRLIRELNALRRLVRIDPKLVVRTSEAFGEELDIEVLRIERSGGPSSVVIFGVDHGDADGGGERDARRATFVRVLRATVRTIDVAYRTGIAETGPGLDRHAPFRNAYCALLSAGVDGRPPALAYSPDLELGTGRSRLAGLADIEPTDGSSRFHR